MASCCMPDRSSMALITRTAKLVPGTHNARCARAMAVDHAVELAAKETVVIGRAG